MSKIGQRVVESTELQDGSYFDLSKREEQPAYDKEERDKWSDERDKDDLEFRIKEEEWKMFQCLFKIVFEMLLKYWIVFSFPKSLWECNNVRNSSFASHVKFNLV